MRRARPTTLLLATSIVALWATVPNLKAAEFEKSTPYYEDDAWYDVSEWLDGNDYNPTDEVAGKWDDEVYRGNTASTDTDNDDTNRTANKANETKQSTHSWASHYDKSGRYSDYGNANRDGNYQSTSIYYDFDHDGYCDAVLSYQDNDGDGSYDGVEYLAFNSTKADDAKALALQSQKSSKRHEVSGTVKNTQMVELRNAGQRLVAEVSTDDNKAVMVDLGSPAQYSKSQKLDDEAKDKQRSSTHQLKAGDHITANGPMVKIGDKQILLAQSAKVGDQEEQQINRSGRMINGKVTKLKTAKVRGQQHQMALLKLNSGKQALIDLGTDTSKFNLAEGDEIGVNGVPVKIKDRLVIIANSITKDGEKTKIDRLASKNKAKAEK